MIPTGCVALRNTRIIRYFLHNQQLSQCHFEKHHVRHKDRGTLLGAEMCFSLDTHRSEMPVLMAVSYLLPLSHLLLPMFHDLMLILSTAHFDVYSF